MGYVRFLPSRRTVAGRTAGALSALCACTLLMLEASIAAGAVGTLGEGIAAYDRGDYPLAFEILGDLALDGNPAALAKAGRMVELGRGTEKNLDQAVRYYREGAIRGDASAQANLARMYLNGTGVPRNEDEGLRWMRRAADQGDSTAIVQMATIFLEGQGVAKDTQRGMAMVHDDQEQSLPWTPTN